MDIPPEGRDATFQKIVPPNEILVAGCLSDRGFAVVLELTEGQAATERRHDAVDDAWCHVGILHPGLQTVESFIPLLLHSVIWADDDMMRCFLHSLAARAGARVPELPLLHPFAHSTPSVDMFGSPKSM